MRVRRTWWLLPILLVIPTSRILGIDDHTRGRGWRKSGRNGIDEPPVLAPAGERETGSGWSAVQGVLRPWGRSGTPPYLSHPVAGRAGEWWGVGGYEIACITAIVPWVSGHPARLRAGDADRVKPHIRGGQHRRGWSASRNPANPSPSGTEQHKTLWSGERAHINTLYILLLL